MPETWKRLSATPRQICERVSANIHAVTDEIRNHRKRSKEYKLRSLISRAETRALQQEQADEIISRLGAALDTNKVCLNDYKWLLTAEDQAASIPTYFWTKAQIRQVIRLAREYEKLPDWFVAELYVEPEVRQKVKEGREHLQEILKDYPLDSLI
ncbi:MAG: hypothetical protein HETSPECPRED_004451 [Heterodermia speciosa]|uniref:Uncharacterized protein n=1 Tax=Heterodermia speciosa TaxID=116794 RepID=A0A8H3IAQ5_9LECA|nr:MAG: hypothetical protein HETSPECPRED_004451 [Heterodermia speciosa]